MAILHILTLDEEEALRRTSRQVDAITDRITTLLDDMYETMQKAEGVGLAAPQVGVLRRVVVIQTPDSEKLELINPEIIHRDGSQTGEEGCLSIPNEVGIVKRPFRVKVRAMNRKGDIVTINGEGLLARCLCHEIDHLEGILYTDRAERMLTPEEIAEQESESDS